MFELPTGGTAQMWGQDFQCGVINILYFATKEQCLTLATNLGSRLYKPPIKDYKIFRLHYNSDPLLIYPGADDGYPPEYVPKLEDLETGDGKIIRARVAAGIRFGICSIIKD